MNLDKETIEQLDDRYVRECDCSNFRAAIANREADLDKSLAKLDVKLNWLVAMLGAIGTAVLSMAVKLLFGA